METQREEQSREEDKSLERLHEVCGKRQIGALIATLFKINLRSCRDDGRVLSAHLPERKRTDARVVDRARLESV